MENKLKLIQDNPPWYKEGLNFKCTGCGKCCSGSPGYVWLLEDEITKIADYLKISKEDFCKKFLIQVGSRYSLRDLKHQNYSCIFLKDKQCSIYPVRPRQCQTYPFWPSVVNSSQSWEEEARECEGIRESSLTVSLEEIEEKLKS